MNPALAGLSREGLSLKGAQAWAQALGLDRLDAQLLLLQVMGRSEGDRAWLLAHDTDPMNPAQAAGFEHLCRRRLTGEPVAYLLGRKEFWGLDLTVDARVLVPRPDTETLVAWALEVLETCGGRRVLDLGTGSGAIALALAHARPGLQVEAVDQSAEALAVARANGERLGLAVTWRQASWLDGAPAGLDLIVSNPPYIAAQDPHLAALTHEPLAALASGEDGLDDLRTIVAAAPGHLVAGGWLLLEHGWDQAESVRALLAQAGFEGVGSRHDLGGHARCSGGRWPGKTAGAAGSGAAGPRAEG